MARAHGQFAADSERMSAAEDAQRQRQLTAQDKKLQIAISRAEKAAEVEERKQQRPVMLLEDQVTEKGFSMHEFPVVGG